MRHSSIIPYFSRYSLIQFHLNLICGVLRRVFIEEPKCNISVFPKKVATIFSNLIHRTKLKYPECEKLRNVSWICFFNFYKISVSLLVQINNTTYHTAHTSVCLSIHYDALYFRLPISITILINEVDKTSFDFIHTDFQMYSRPI